MRLVHTAKYGVRPAQLLFRVYARWPSHTRIEKQQRLRGLAGGADALSGRFVSMKAKEKIIDFCLYLRV